MKKGQVVASEPIAIVGISCLLPGAETPSQYWSNLVDGVDSIRAATQVDWHTEPEALFREGRGVPDATSSLLGGWREDVAAESCALDPEYVAKLDRVFRWALRCGGRALDDANIDIEDKGRQRCANILAAYSWSPTFSSAELFRPMYLDKLQSTLSAYPELAKELGLAQGAIPAENACVAGRLASITAEGHKLGGPSYAIDAACASSLYGLKLGALHLRSRQCDFALVSGISAYHPAFATLGFSALQALADNTRSRPLHASSDGLAPAEGCVSFVLQRLQDAQQDGREIHGVIRGVGLSNDGRGRHLLAPKSIGQQLACRRALAEAEVLPGSVDYIDCHATGTSVGDTTELETLAALYPEGQFPLIGSAKSNFGHLLTAAGLAGALKVLLGMKAGKHAASIGIDEPIQIEGRADVAASIVTESKPWPTKKGNRRGAVNAFGFGGANSQLILDQFPSEKVSTARDIESVPMLITGMAGHYGDCRNLIEIKKRAIDPKPFFGELHSSRWDGFSPLGKSRSSQLKANPIVEVDLDALRYQLVPEAIEKMNPQQLVMLDVADQALQDSGVESGGHVAVIITHAEDLIVHRLQMRWQVEALLEKALRKTGMNVSPNHREEILEMLKETMHPTAGSTDFASYIANLMASRIASLWDFSGPAFSLTAQESSTSRGLQIARMFMASGEADAVLLGAVDMAAHAENVLLRHLLDIRGSSDMPPCDGAGALVLEKESTSVKNVYATIESEALSSLVADTGSGSHSREALNSALEIANRKRDEISLIYTDDPEETISLVEQEFSSSAPDSVCLASSTRAFGNAYAASQMLDLILSASALNERQLPPVGKDWQCGSLPQPLYLTESAIPWTRSSSQARAALIQACDSTGTASCIVLSDRHRRKAPLHITTSSSDSRYVIPVLGKNSGDLIASLSSLSSEMAAGESLDKLSLRSIEAHVEKSSESTVALCAASPLAMQEELDNALTHLRSNPDKSWHSPSGSRYHPNPLGEEGQIAFVYPPFDTPYPGMQADLYSMFPRCMERIEEGFSDSEKALSASGVFPRSSQALTSSQREKREREMLGNTFAMLRAGVAHSVSSTIAVREVLGIQPEQAFGYSFGEISMLVAMGVWPMESGWIDAIETSNLLSMKIGGEHLAARKHFGCEKKSDFEWASRVILASVEQVKQKLGGISRVFVSQASTRSETVICGERSEVLKACELIGADTLRMESSLAVHCPVAGEVMSELQSLLRTTTNDPGEVALRFSGNDSPVKWQEDSVARVVADGIVGHLDFPRLVDDAYESGARIFIELGARNTCTRRISSILNDKPHLALAIDQRGTSARDSYAMFIAACVAHKIPFNASAWCKSLDTGRSYKLRVTKSIARTRSVTLTTTKESTNLTQGETTVSGAGGNVALLASLEHRAWLDNQRSVLGRGQQRASRVINSDESCLFDEAAVMEFSEGKLARVFGPEYAEFDELPQRMRLPSPPFLALSRVLSIEANRFSLDPCSIVTEFDLPDRYWGKVGNQASFMAADAQGVLFLLGYLGIDRWLEGIRSYRWLDAKMNFTGRALPVGSTIRYDIRIRSFTQHGDTLLFLTDFDCDVDGQRFLEIRDCTAGFFTDEELKKGQGLASRSFDELKNDFVLPLSFPLSKKEALTEDELTAWQDGKMSACFGAGHAEIERLNPALRLVPGPMRMIDRISLLSPPSSGGYHLIAEKYLHPGDWYLRSHFKDAPVFAGPCMVEGCFQALQCYAVYLGLPEGLQNARFSPAEDCRMEVKFRGQVPAEAGTFVMKMRITEIENDSSRSLHADFDLVYKERIIGRITGLGIKLEGSLLPNASDLRNTEAEYIS